MKKIKYEDLPSELKVLVKRMEKDLNSQKNQKNHSESPLRILTENPIMNRSTDNDDTTECDVVVFRVEAATGKYIFSHIENNE